MNVRVIFLCVLVDWWAYVHNADSLHSGECYGSGHMFHLHCGNDSRIALDNIYVIAMSTNCSGVQVKDTPASTCCETDLVVNDCKMNYTGYSVNAYHEACLGKRACSKEIAWQTIPCVLSDVSEQKYMTVEYHCVETSGIVHIPSNNSANKSTVSIQNEGHPSSGQNASAGMCSVTASHNSSIDVSLLHLNITCQQYLDILDGSVRERIDCKHNTNYSSGTLYTSKNKFISLNWTSELTASGRIWIQFTATNSLANLELRCVASSTTEPGVSTFPQTNFTMTAKSHATTPPNVTVYTDTTKSTTKFTNNLLTTPAVPPVLSTPIQTSASIQPIPTMMTTTTSNPQTSASSQPITTMMTTTTSTSQTSESSKPIPTMMTTTTSNPQTSASSQPISTMMTTTTSTPQTSASSQPIPTMMTTTTSTPQTSASSQPISTMMTTTTSNPQTSASIQPISTMMTTTSNPQTSASIQPISTMMTTSNPQTSASIQPISTMKTTTTSNPPTSASIQPIPTMMTTTTPNPQTSSSIQPISSMVTTTASNPQTPASIQSISTMMRSSKLHTPGSIQPNAPSHLETTTLLSTSPHGGMSLAEAAGIGVGVVVSFLLLLILLCFLHKKKHQRVKVGNQGDDVLDSEFADALGITRANMGSTAPTFVILPTPRRLAPIEVPVRDIHL